MLKTEWLEMEGKLPVGDRPFIWQIKKFPLTAAFDTAMVVSVFLFPFFGIMPCGSGRTKI